MLSFRNEEEKTLSGSIPLTDLSVYLAKLINSGNPLHNCRRHKDDNCIEKQNNNAK
jgi:hypothetical protein